MVKLRIVCVRRRQALRRGRSESRLVDLSAHFIRKIALIAIFINSSNGKKVRSKPLRGYVCYRNAG